MIETKDKILDAAERLFGERGYAETSLRHIIADAGVNLAAIHYHFGSKEDLLVQLVRRRAEPINAGRLAALDQAEAEAGPASVSVEKILEAFLLPAAEAAAKRPEMTRLMGRLHAEGCIPPGIKSYFTPMVERFIAAARRALPHLPEEELLWRLRASAGAMAFTMLEPHAPQGDYLARARQLVAFVSGGLRAPASVVEAKVEVTQ
ncbi:MAG TPA: TetR/AcrR family transcriptional regulator [Bryobacteraceae bacterium]|nr:TetR/AcrR family transcriptional regulator [Bryobacteraceae bacterium]